MKRFFSTTILIVLIGLSGCKEDETGEASSGFNRQEMLTDLADKVIIPSYAALNAEVTTLNSALEGFTENPTTEALIEARTKFASAYHAWQHAAFWEFGPAFDVLLKSSVNSFPADKINIENNVASGSYDFNATAGQDEKGFPGIDYLLFGIAENDEDILEKYLDDTNAAKRKAYLLAVSADLKTRVEAVNNGWSESGDDYRQEFIQNDGTAVGSSVGLMVNELNKFVERETRDDKIGIPLGKRSQGLPFPASVEAGHSDLSISLATENVSGIYDFYMGKGPQEDGKSFYEYLKALDAQYGSVLLADAIKEQFETVLKEVSEIPSPFDETLENNPAPADEAYTELQKLVVLLKADMPSALAVLVTYQDNDGD